MLYQSSVAPLPAQRRSTISRSQVRLIVITHLLAAVALGFPSPRALIAFGVAYVLSAGIGISVGFHRGLSHCAFAAPRALMLSFSALGTLALQGGPITWVGLHRAHHKFADREGDPHSAARGFWWSHVLWAFHKGPNGYRPMRLAGLTHEVARDPVLRWLERNHLIFNLGMFGAGIVLLGPAVALWAFPLRIVFVWHLAWLVNSLAHDSRRAREMPGDSARNLHAFALISFGEGLHANHHERPRRASFARRWYEVDVGFAFLWLLAKVRLVALRSR